MNEPLVSVLIPVYNAGEYLRSSVQSILCQSYSNLEILIIDDGSNDHCMESIADINDFRVRVITQKNTGRAAALNHGLEQLSGTFYATQDADDISHPWRIERQVHCLLERPDLAAVFTGHEIIFEGRHIAPRFAAKSVQQCYRDIEQLAMPALDPTGMFRVSMVRAMRYEPTLKVGAGLDYILRVGEIYHMMVLGECLYSYRIHSGSTSRHDPTRRKQMVGKVLRRACQRRGLDPAGYLPTQQTPAAKYLHRQQESGIIPHFMESVLNLRVAKRNWQAMKTALTCLKLHPMDPYYYKPLVYFVLPFALIMYYRSRKACS